ncbi:cytochrome P450 3A13 [Trichonephila clavipes]|nr:cytochrome P450 3A13 [Trichonephila clavipes]
MNPIEHVWDALGRRVADRQPPPQTLQELERAFLEDIISETLRLYPPTIRMERMAIAEYKLGDTGITIPKGMIVNIPAYAMHMDPKLFPDPEKFDPDR